MDAVSGPYFWIDAELEKLSLDHQFRKLRLSQGASKPRLQLDGREFLQFSSNNYLGLASHPRLIAAAQKAAAEFGTGSGASRLISGNQNPIVALEEGLAEFKGSEAALVFATGSMANSGCIPALVGEGDWVILDKADHATLYDGARLSGAQLKRFPHADLARLEKLLQEAQTQNVRRILLAVEAVYSMDGDILNFPKVAELCRIYNAMLLVDEAHSTGVLGKGGHGILEHFASNWPEHLVITGTLSKALGSLGGFVACSEKLRSWLINAARSFIFASALPASAAAAAMEAIQLIQEEPERVERLRSHSAYLAKGIQKLGWKLLSAESPILPILIGSAEAVLKEQEKLLEVGIYVPAIRSPTVPSGMCRLRLSVSAEHSQEDLDTLLRALGPM